MRNGDWCILRTGAASTIRLAASLREAGIETWTPIEVRSKRASRSRKRVDVEVPITPTFVFASYARLSELIEMAHSPSMTFQVWDSEKRRMVSKGYPFFSVFRFAGEYRPLPDAQLAPLRRAEQRVKRPPKAKKFNVGERVRLTEGGSALEGIMGEVIALSGSHVSVSFPGWDIPIKIASGYLSAVDSTEPVNVNNGLTEQAMAAK